MIIRRWDRQPDLPLPKAAARKGGGTAGQVCHCLRPRQENSLWLTTMMDNSKTSMGEFHSFNANDLIGKTVKNKQGETLGKVEDLVIGSDGTADFVVLSRGFG